jgi:cellulose synthase/poly-beta-1,6-N-acetylglucosamine synthase-like glycosyltransferase
MTLAFALVNDVRARGRERLGLSCGLRGNGMCFTRGTLERVPPDAFSIVEDAEYGIRLAEAGIRVAYASETQVLGEMVSGERASRSQRLRWERGRASLRVERGPILLREAIRRRSWILLDLALDLYIPPLATLTAFTLVVAAVASVHAWQLHGSRLPFQLALTSLVFVGLYVLRGWQVSGLGPAFLFWLPFIPVFVLWKAMLRLTGSARPPQEFVRTAREERSDTLDGKSPNPPHVS